MTQVDTSQDSLDARLARFWRDSAGEDARALGEALLEAGRHDACREVAEAALRLRSGDPELQWLFARACFEQRNLLPAQAALLAILEHEPRHAAACRLLGQVFLKRGDPERACRALERASQLSTAEDAGLERLMLRARRLLAIASGEFEAELAPDMQPQSDRPREPSRPAPTHQAPPRAVVERSHSRPTPEPSVPQEKSSSEARESSLGTQRSGAETPADAARASADTSRASAGRSRSTWLMVGLTLLAVASYAGWRYGLRPVPRAAPSAADTARPSKPDAPSEAEPRAPSLQPMPSPESKTAPERQPATREEWLARIREALDADAPDVLREHLADAEEMDPSVRHLARGARAALAGDEEAARRHLGAVGSQDGLALATLRARAALRLSDPAFLHETQQVLQGALNEAEEPSSQATSLVTRLRTRRARLALEAGRPEDALSMLEPVVKPTSRDASLLALYGDALYAVARVDAAAGAYNRALEIDPEQPNALLGRARTEVRADKHGAAVARLKRLLQILPEQGDPRRAQALTLLGRALLRRRGKGDRKRARELLDRAAELPGAPVEVYFWQGEAHAGRRVSKAIRAYRAYLEAAPEGEYARRAERALSR